MRKKKKIFKVICDAVHNTNWKPEDKNLIVFVKAKDKKEALQQATYDWKKTIKEIARYNLDKTLVIEVNEKYDPTRIS